MSVDFRPIPAYGLPPLQRVVWQAVPIDIEALLVWTYRDQKADRVLGMGLGLFDQEAELDGREAFRTSPDGMAAIGRIAALGTRVDGGGASASHLHIDAEIVHGAVCQLAPHVAAMVQKHARAGSRPDDETIPIPRPIPARDGRGRTRLGYDPWDKHRDYGWCLLEWTASPVSAEVIRLEYAAWHRALKLLALALTVDLRLTRNYPTPPAAPTTPNIRMVIA